MNLIAPTIFDRDLLNYYANNSVTSVYGKLPVDYMGGGHESAMLRDATWETLCEHVACCKKLGMSFNYVMNSTCMGLSEFDNGVRYKIFAFFDHLRECGVQSVTVSNPSVLAMIKQNYSDIEVKVSACCYVKSVSEVKYWESLGADIIVLDPLQVNRDFRTLKGIAKAASVDLELIVNNNCFQFCPEIYNHQNFLSHSSHHTLTHRIEHDFSYNWCSKERLREPARYLIADWIRPEDTKYYEEIGFKRFKITDRNTPLNYLKLRAKAYHERYYEGNLLDIIQHFAYRDTVSPNDYIENIHIDNRKLDDFIRIFLKSECRAKDCGGKCRHCFDVADNAITRARGFGEKLVPMKQGIDYNKNSRSYEMKNVPVKYATTLE